MQTENLCSSEIHTVLTKIANRCGTDKGTIHGAGHGYTIIYDLILAPFRGRSINLLEIGLAAGGPEVDAPVCRSANNIPSIRMWHEYFPQANLYGLDICDFSNFETDWFKFLQADCGSEENLRRVADSGLKFDIIIDDGSHASYHQQLALKILFPMLKTSGLYIIEDLDWQPHTYEATLPKVSKTVDFLRQDQFETTLFFGEDELVSLRKLYNRRAGLSAPIPHYIDRFNVIGYLRRLGETASNGLRALRGMPMLTPRTKLAVIQKG